MVMVHVSSLLQTCKKLIFQGGKSVATMGNPLTVDKQVGKSAFAHLFMC